MSVEFEVKGPWLVDAGAAEGDERLSRENGRWR
jgi:hypothetical protein